MTNRKDPIFAAIEEHRKLAAETTRLYKLATRLAERGSSVAKGPYVGEDRGGRPAGRSAPIGPRWPPPGVSRGSGPEQRAVQASFWPTLSPISAPRARIPQARR